MLEFTNRKWFKNVKFFALSIIMIGLALFCALHDFTNNTRGTNLIAHPVGWVGLLFFGYGLVFMLYKNIKYALQGRGMIEITDEGLFVRDEFVAWGNIVGIYGNKYYINIDTNDIHERLLRASLWSRLSYKMSGVMVRISDFDYDGSQEEFAEKLKQQYMKNKEKNLLNNSKS